MRRTPFSPVIYYDLLKPEKPLLEIGIKLSTRCQAMRYTYGKTAGIRQKARQAYCKTILGHTSRCRVRISQQRFERDVPLFASFNDPWPFRAALLTIRGYRNGWIRGKNKPTIFLNLSTLLYIFPIINITILFSIIWSYN